MYWIFTLLFTSTFAIATGEMIGSVEYSLPEIAKDWVVSSKIEGKQSTTILYTPKNERKEKATEIFALVDTTHHIDINDVDSMEAEVKLNHPSLKIEFKVLEKNSKSILYEVSGTENETPKMHSWTRIIVTKPGMVMLTYMTYKTGNVDLAREEWVPALISAHLK